MIVYVVFVWYFEWCCCDALCGISLVICATLLPEYFVWYCWDILCNISFDRYRFLRSASKVHLQLDAAVRGCAIYCVYYFCDISCNIAVIFYVVSCCDSLRCIGVIFWAMLLWYFVWCFFGDLCSVVAGILDVILLGYFMQDFWDVLCNIAVMFYVILLLIDIASFVPLWRCT